MPVVLCLSGHDPSGGAGIQADIESVRAQGVHPATVVTALTVQDSRNVYAVEALPSQGVIQAAESLLADLPVRVIKLGMLGSAANATAIAALLARHATIPVVLDPVLHASGGAELSGQAVVDAMLQDLLPRTTVLTPNLKEARVLAKPAQGRDECARALLARAVRHVLITGGDEADEAEVVNSLHGAGGVKAWRWPRLPAQYHGSGCTLAASLAARLALGEALPQAAESAQQYTLDTLRRASRIGHGRHFPLRIEV